MWNGVPRAIARLAIAASAALALPGASPVLFDSADHRISVPARLNDGKPAWLVVDTGAAVSVLEKKRLPSLGLEAAGRHRLQGAGGPQEASRVQGVAVHLEGLELLDQTMDTLALEPLSAQTGRPLDGILGYPVFARRVIVVDYPRRRLSFLDAGGYRYSGPGKVVPIELVRNRPYATARVVLPGGRAMEGRFLIDTGASSSLSLWAAGAAGKEIVASFGKTLTVQARGVGGAFDVRLGRVERLELGGFTLARPVAVLRPVEAGQGAARTLGSIGGAVLDRFKVIFDYPRRRMILEPGPGLNEPFEVDMSGLTLIAALPAFQRVHVERVLAGSPASEAGVQAGDEIAAVNGTPAVDIGLPALRERFRRQDQKVHLELWRGRERVVVELRTRRMI
jgi:Aspartyl protease/PDZ domain